MCVVALFLLQLLLQLRNLLVELADSLFGHLIHLLHLLAHLHDLWRLALQLWWKHGLESVGNVVRARPIKVLHQQITGHLHHGREHAAKLNHLGSGFFALCREARASLTSHIVFARGDVIDARQAVNGLLRLASFIRLRLRAFGLVWREWLIDRN